VQQRQLRLGDILDDYCPRERRVTNHVIVAMIAEDVKQVRCTTCDADHDFKHAKVPRQRRKTETPAALYAQVLSTGPKRVAHEPPAPPAVGPEYQGLSIRVDGHRNDPARGPRFAQWLPTSNLRIVSIAVGSNADTVLSRLQLMVTTTRGKGERASIALAASDTDLVFTGMDRGGMWIALRELWSPGERLLALPGFLRRLVDARAITGEAAEDVLRQSKHVVPTWWPGWRAAS
jgi:hypothetical protein